MAMDCFASSAAISHSLINSQGDGYEHKDAILFGNVLGSHSDISGCWLLAAGGAGAYGGYKAKEEGYTCRNLSQKREPIISKKGTKRRL